MPPELIPQRLYEVLQTSSNNSITNLMTNMNIEDLKQKPVAMMTGEELSFLMGSSMAVWAEEIASRSQRRTYYGIEGIAQIFGCSVPTANRIKKSGVIDDAITQIDRQIVIDGDLALELAKKAGSIKIKGDANV